MKQTLLLVEDEFENRNAVKRVLNKESLRILEAENGQEALDILEKESVDLILLDIGMPIMDGFTFLAHYKGVESNRSTPVCVMTAWSSDENRQKVIDMGADDFVSKPFDNTELKTRVKSLLRISDYQKHLLHFNHELDKKVEERTYELIVANNNLETSKQETFKAYHDVVIHLSLAAEFKDKVTASHIQRMSHYSALLAKKIGWADEDVALLLDAAKMHDIGKIGIPDAILNKPGKLTKEEYLVMQNHTEFGASILAGSSSKLLQMAEQVALTHHERFDGTGYPRQMKGKDIPEIGRIVAIADVYDALITRRPYKEPWPLEKVYRVMQENSGTQFDSELLALFLQDREALIEISYKFPDVMEQETQQVSFM
jgi:putative two-component system response regulator